MVIYMVEITDDKIEKDERVTKILSKVNMITKMMKTIHDDVDEIKQKMVKNTGEVVKVEKDEKEKIDKIFEAKGVGRPRGSYSEKQKQYINLLNEGRIKQPKDKTLEFYKIGKDKEGKYYLWPDET